MLCMISFFIVLFAQMVSTMRQLVYLNGQNKMVSGYQGGKEKQGMGGAQFADDSCPNNQVKFKSALN